MTADLAERTLDKAIRFQPRIDPGRLILRKRSIIHILMPLQIFEIIHLQ